MPANPTPSQGACRFCGGTGFRKEVAHVDGGRCWHCSSTNDIVYLTDAEFAAQMAEHDVERAARRAARKAAR